MAPRSSPEALQEVVRIFTERHGDRLRAGERFAASQDGDSETETLMVDVVDGPAVFRFEARVHLEDVPGRETPLELLSDFLDAIVDEWLSGDREAFPTLDFSPYPFRDVTVGLRGGLQRPDLEAMADELLRRGDPSIQ